MLAASYIKGGNFLNNMQRYDAGLSLFCDLPSWYCECRIVWLNFGGNMRTIFSVTTSVFETFQQTYFNFSRWETKSLFSKESKIID